METQCENLSTLTSIVFHSEMAKMQRLNDEENRLRALLDELTLSVASSKSSGIDDVNEHTMRALGADILWQAWVGKRKAALQMQMANLRVRKANAIDALRLAFAKAEVTKELSQTERAQMVTALTRKMSDGLNGQMVYRGR